MAYVQIQTLIANSNWEGLVAQLEDLELSHFPSVPVPQIPLVANNGTHASVLSPIDASLCAHDSRVYALLLAAHLLTDDVVAARMLFRRTPAHVGLTSWEFGAIAEVAAALHDGNPAQALALLASYKSYPTLLAHTISVTAKSFSQTPSAPVSIILLTTPEAASDAAEDLLATALNKNTLPHAFSRLVSPIVDILADVITRRVLVSVARSHTAIRVSSLTAMIAWPRGRVAQTVADGSLKEAMNVESVTLESDVLRIVAKSEQNSAMLTSSAGPGLDQVRDLAKYLVHLEREV
ncbi:hypothetical protein HDU77_008313 [Chytriomyces hyalinus]|nr:hypothetical protein HDU77_008313 [Chytriomyces hyalinus]